MKKINKYYITRYLKIENQIQKDLSKIIQNYFIYIKIKFITITNVKFKKGDKNAKIFFTSINKNKKNIKNILFILNNNSKIFKNKLSKKLRIFSTPDLKFIYDNSYFRINKILNLIKIANKK